MAKKGSKKQSKSEVGFDTHIRFVMDRSGSMESIRNDTIGGFNTFLKEQKELDAPGTITYSHFDNVYDVVHKNVPIKKMPELDRETFQPRGSTSLLDAIGRSITETDQAIESGDIGKGTQIFFVIITDGQENTSREYTRDRIFDMITEKTKAGWEFVYLGANQDAIATATDYGMSVGNTLNYKADMEGVTAMYANVSASMSNSRMYKAKAGNLGATASNFFAAVEEDDDDDKKEESA